MIVETHTIPDDLRPADYARLAREIQRAGAGPDRAPINIAFLSTFTLEFVNPFLVVEGARRGLWVASYFGGFGQFEQEIGSDTRLGQFAPDVLVLAMRPEDVDPDAAVRYYATDGRRFAERLQESIDRIGQLVKAFRQWSTAPVLVANFATPARLPLGIFDANVGEALTYAIQRANEELQRRVTSMAGVVLWDYAGLVRASGAGSWTDRRLWALGRIAVAAAHQPALARHLVRTVAGARQRPAKCLVLDLDNTLWGGVIGDDGVEGIKLSDDYPGNVYKGFQRAALSLKDRGILLAVVSKNDESVARQVFDEHPEMLIRWEDLAAARVNWNPKSQNLLELAEELNIGADALVLFDDNPVERAEARANAPAVGVIEVPADPLAYEEALWESGFFDQVSLSDEDRSRTEMYHAEQKRQTHAQRFDTVDDFLYSLEMVAAVGEAGPATIGRITQLVNKTNQFNLTTRRHTQTEIDAMARDPSQVVAWLRLRDRFGDQGLVAVGILRCEGRMGVLDTCLMSCRVMNRHVEEALLAYLAEHARRLGCEFLAGEYRPTKKNGMVRDLYPRLGFVPDGEVADGGCRYTLDLRRVTLAWPDVIDRQDAG